MAGQKINGKFDTFANFNDFQPRGLTFPKIFNLFMCYLSHLDYLNWLGTERKKPDIKESKDEKETKIRTT